MNFKFFKRHKYLDGRLHSEFEVWLSRKIICPLFGHAWEWWQLLKRDKCKRCFDARGESFEEHFRNGFLVWERQYRELQVPFWVRAGQRLTEEEKQEQKYMKHKGYDYYDMQRERESKAPQLFKKDMDKIKNPLKAQPVEYQKGNL